MKTIAMTVIFPVVVPCILFTAYALKKSFRQLAHELYSVVDRATNDPVTKHPYFGDPNLIQRLWQTPSAKRYIQTGALRYQKSEGFCGSATLQVVLQSFVPIFPAELVPDQIQGPSTPTKLCEGLHEMVKDAEQDVKIETTVVEGGLGYEKFLQTLKLKLADENCRVAVNYLRPALVGFQWPKWVPANLFLGLFGGHFSPVVGILEEPHSNSSSKDEKDDPLVGVFDVNSKWGLYLVPASRLYDSVVAKDMTTGKSRAMVIFEMES
eukprot:CAMPEP_0194039596 /NCGR_PEP_ID=MMETSP0009_2-20130614/11713_1 /TAXON_ID=210454 /ORGANISM="Grammatophora oceanica, Strain CCMP 410" /LENGTH=265 /DNA_ID=CAMNT_0038682491 /DNA_START=1 /DNA_END=798 /DNA_ORIENTATION=-